MNLKPAILTGAAITLAIALGATAQAAPPAEISIAAVAPMTDPAAEADGQANQADQPAPMNLDPPNLTLPSFDFSQPNLSDNGPGGGGAAPPPVPIAGGSEGALVGSPQSGPTPGVPAL